MRKFSPKSRPMAESPKRAGIALQGEPDGIQSERLVYFSAEEAGVCEPPPVTPIRSHSHVVRHAMRSRFQRNSALADCWLSNQPQNPPSHSPAKREPSLMGTASRHYRATGVSIEKLGEMLKPMAWLQTELI